MATRQLLWKQSAATVQNIVFFLPSDVLSARAASQTWKAWMEQRTTIEELRSILCELVRLDNYEEELGNVEGLSPVQYHVSGGSFPGLTAPSREYRQEAQRLCLQPIARVFPAGPHGLTLPLQALTHDILAQIIDWSWRGNRYGIQRFGTKFARIDNMDSLNHFFETHVAKVRNWCTLDSDFSSVAHGSDFLRNLNACRIMMRTLLADYTFYHVHLDFYTPLQDREGETHVDMDVLIYHGRTGKTVAVSLSVDPTTGELIGTDCSSISDLPTE